MALDSHTQSKRNLGFLFFYNFCMCTFSFLLFQVKGPLSVHLKDVAGHSQHLILERFTSGHTQAKGLITVQSQDAGELLPVQLIIRIM